MNKPERVKCKCHCHVDKNVKHVIPCCDNGWIELPVVPAPTVATDNSGEPDFISKGREIWKERYPMLDPEGWEAEINAFAEIFDIGARHGYSIATVASPVEEEQEQFQDKIEFIKGAFQCYVGGHITMLEKFLSESKFQITRKPTQTDK